MKKIIITSVMAIIAFMFFILFPALGLAQQPANQQPDMTIDAATRSQVIRRKLTR